MNQTSSTDTSIFTSNRLTAESISRRAYELWEQEGRPEGSDLRHWLQAEQELAGQSEQNTRGTTSAAARPAPSPSGDVRPLQGTRAAAAAGREGKRGSRTPFNAEKSAASSTAVRPEPAGGRRRS